MNDADTNVGNGDRDGDGACHYSALASRNISVNTYDNTLNNAAASSSSSSSSSSFSPPLPPPEPASATPQDSWSPLLKMYARPPVTCYVTIEDVRTAAGDVLVRFTVETTHPSFTESRMSNERSLADFVTLAAFLAKAYPANLLPMLPPRAAVLRSADVAQCAPYATYIRRLIQHPVASADPSFVNFIASSAAFAPYAATKPAVCVPPPSLSEKLLSKVLPAPHDKNESFVARLQTNEERQFATKKVLKALATLVHAQNHLAIACGDFSRSAAALASSEQDATLARRWNGLGESVHLLSEISVDNAAHQSLYMTESLGSFLEKYSRVDAALKTRLHGMRLFEDSQRSVERQTRKIDRIRNSGGSTAETSSALTQVHSQPQSDANVEVLVRLRETQVGCFREFRLATELLDHDWAESERQREADSLRMVSGWLRVVCDGERRVHVEVWNALRSYYTVE